MTSVRVRGYEIPQHIYTAVVQLWDGGIYSEPYIASEIYRLYNYNISSDFVWQILRMSARMQKNEACGAQSTAMIPLTLTLTSLLHLLLFLAPTSLTTAVPPTQRRARFNCPDVPAPAWVSQTTYPRLFRYCISFDADCDCRRDARVPGLTVYRPVCNIERQADLRDVQLQRGLQICEDTCFCYGGPTSNWERWPMFAPPEIGPLLGVAGAGRGEGSAGSPGGSEE